MSLKLILFIVIAAASATVVNSWWSTQGYGQGCSVFKQCGSGLSYQPGVHVCYHSPRRAYEPCSAGYSCGHGLSCHPVKHKCYHKPRRFGEPCSVVGYPCGNGLTCKIGDDECIRQWTTSPKIKPCSADNITHEYSLTLICIPCYIKPQPCFAY